MMSAIGRNASKVLRASARSGQVQEATKVIPALQGIRKYSVNPELRVFSKKKTFILTGISISIMASKINLTIFSQDFYM